MTQCLRDCVSVFCVCVCEILRIVVYWVRTQHINKNIHILNPPCNKRPHETGAGVVWHLPRIIWHLPPRPPPHFCRKEDDELLYAFFCLFSYRSYVCFKGVIAFILYSHSLLAFGFQLSRCPIVLLIFQEFAALCLFPVENTSPNRLYQSVFRGEYISG